MNLPPKPIVSDDERDKSRSRIDPGSIRPDRAGGPISAVPPSPSRASTATTAASTPPTSTATLPAAVVATIAVGAAPTQVTVAAGAVWVAVWDTGKLVRVDPATNRVVARIPVRGGAGGIGAGAGAVWVTSGEGGDQQHGWVQRIDPTRNRVVATTTVPSGMLWDIAIDGPSVWVGSELGGLWRIDAHTSKVTTIRKPGGAPAVGAGGVGHVAAGAGAVWFSAGQSLARFDVTANCLVATLSNEPTAGATTLTDINGVAVGAGAVWVLTNESLLRIDPTRVTQ